jgi:DNA-binding protein YbaB
VSQGTEDRLAHYAEMKEEITAIRATVSSQDRAVTVVAGAGGSVVDIRVADEALRDANPQTLGRSIMSTIQLAIAQAAKAQAEVVQRYVGDRMNILDRVNAVQQEFFDKAKEEDARQAREEQHPQFSAPAQDRVQPPAPPQPTPPPAPQPAPQQQFQPPARHARQEPPRRRGQGSADSADDGEGFQGLGGSDEW